MNVFSFFPFKSFSPSPHPDKRSYADEGSLNEELDWTFRSEESLMNPHVWGTMEVSHWWNRGAADWDLQGRVWWWRWNVSDAIVRPRLWIERSYRGPFADVDCG